MSRTVSIPRNAVKTAYADASELDQDDWDDAVSTLRETAQARYPSLTRCSLWLDREDRAVLTNGHAYIVISEYNGLVALSVVAKQTNKLALTWCEKFDAEHFVEYFGPRLISQGRFSNGEQVFIRANNPAEHVSANGSRW